MKTAVFSAHKFERDYLVNANKERHELKLLETPLTINTVNLAEECEAISIFVNDDASSSVIEKLKEKGIKFITTRSAGFNNIDLKCSKKLNIKVNHVPNYSPYAVAEHAIALMLALNRKLIRSHNHIIENNFLLDGLVGFDMNGKTVGIIGTGKIGSVVAKILHGFGCKLLAFDVAPNESLKKQFDVIYTDLETIYRTSDIITLHVPLTKESRYLINTESISIMKSGIMLINTSRGGLIDTKAVIEALKTEKIGYFGTDVYENEELFFADHSSDILKDDVFSRLITFNNVIISAHQAFLTNTALNNIAQTTIYNLDCFEKGICSGNEIE
jgi:D-lactate dehydrogenase